MDGPFPSAKVALSIDSVLWIPCSLMASVFGWTLAMENGLIVLGINLLYLVESSLSDLPTEEAAFRSLSM